MGYYNSSRRLQPMKTRFSAFAKRTLALTMAMVLLLSLCPILPLTADAAYTTDGWEFSGSYGTWMEGRFHSDDSDLIFEDSQAYDWEVSIYQNRTSASLTVDATVKDASGATVASITGKSASAVKGQDSIMLSYSDLTALTTNLYGSFTLTCTVNYNGSLAARLTKSFSRVNSNPITSTVTSRSNPDNAFTFADPIDLVLNIKKNDGVATAYNAAVTVTKGSTEVLAARGVSLPASTNIVLSVKDLVNLPAITTAGTSSAAIRSDRGGGTVTVDQGTYKTTGKGSPFIYSTADITVKNANLIATASEGVVIEGKNSVTLENTTLTDTNNTLNGQSTTYKNIFLYQSMSGDAASGQAVFTAKNSTITTNQGDSFYVTNTTAEINLENNQIINNDSTGNLSSEEVNKESLVYSIDFSKGEVPDGMSLTPTGALGEFADGHYVLTTSPVGTRDPKFALSSLPEVLVNAENYDKITVKVKMPAGASGNATLYYACEGEEGYSNDRAVFVHLAACEKEDGYTVIDFDVKKLGGKTESVIKITLPSGIERSLVIIEKTAKTDKCYPRKAGKPLKNPLK